jgi:hypothetical protein
MYRAFYCAVAFRIPFFVFCDVKYVIVRPVQMINTKGSSYSVTLFEIKDKLRLYFYGKSFIGFCLHLRLYCCFTDYSYCSEISEKQIYELA